ncbi:Ribosome-binding factor A [Gammaproteobacteria bacterium]
MPKEFSRSLRFSDQIQRALADLLAREVRDPRVGMVTITSVEVSRDLASAKVFLTVLGDPSEVQESLQVLKRAAGFLRSALARHLNMRAIPALRFVYDPSVERGIYMGQLIREAIESDRQLHIEKETPTPDSDL